MTRRRQLCVTCRWWDQSGERDEEANGWCKVEPPRLSREAGYAMGEWPLTPGYEWCKAWEAWR